jgi:hypothetical protein
MRLLHWNSGVSSGKAILVQDWTGLDGTRKLRLPDSSLLAHEVDKVTSPMHWIPLPLEKIPDTHFRYK